MGCINSVPETKDFTIINNDMFNNGMVDDDTDFLEGVVYMKNMQWCIKASKYIERLCFIMATFTAEQTSAVKLTAESILSNEFAKTPAGQEFDYLCRYLYDIGTFYLECMASIRSHAGKNSLQTFNTVAQCIRIAILSGRRA